MSAPSASLPERIGRYRVQSVIGRGAMGVIYRAHDPDIDRDVAIKLIRADLLEGAARDEFLSRFRREAQAAARCVHPAIVAIYDFALHEGDPFIAMEYIDGESLARTLAREKQLAPAPAIAVMSQLLDALDVAHRAGIIHRDIKSANILLPGEGGGFRGHIKVTDFGISRLGETDLTMAGAIMGTPATMSPEQCRGEPVDARADLFSAGVVLFQMLTGTRPFAGGTPAEAMHNLLHTPPGNLPPDLAHLSEVLARALAKRPEDRFASAAAMRLALLSNAAPPESDGTVVSTGPLMGTLISPEEIERATRALARHLGPIARVLVRRALPATSAQAFRAALAAHIEKPEERSVFLRELG